MSRTNRIAVLLGGFVLLIAIGLVGAYAGGKATEERQDPGASGTPVESLADCPWGEASCVLALGIERALQFGNVDAVVDFGEPAFYDCPGRPQQEPDEPFPLCLGAPEFTRREGYPVAQRFIEGEIVDEDRLHDFIQAFVDAVKPDMSDELDDGRIRLHAFGCPERAPPFLNVACARLAIILTAIVDKDGETQRKLLIFWAIGLFGGETLPVTEVWEGIILPGERRVVLEDGGYIADLGEVYVIDQSLRRVPD
jgi:hypothetical protein